MTIIADNRETIDGLQGYLAGAGVVSHATRSLWQATMVPEPTVALVLFPDDFETQDVVREVSSSRATRPRLLVVMITGNPQRFRPALEPDGRSTLPIVLPKPAFGWTILDAIREHARVEAP